MKVLNVSKRQLKKMPQLNLSSSIISTEAQLYVHDFKKDYNHLVDLIKIYYNQEKDYMVDKIAIITRLIATFEFLDMKELVVPTALVSLDGEIAGMAMPYVQDNVNMTLLLNNPKINLQTRLKWLKEILGILIKINDSHDLQGKFFLGDIHEANFILDIADQMIKAVDIDSSYFNGGPVPISKFTTYNHLLLKLTSKYLVDEESQRFIPSKDMTSVSFIYMLLNVLSGDKSSHRWSYNEFYSYLGFLKKKEVSQELLDIISNLYTGGNIDIYNPDLLDGIDENKDYTMVRARINRTSGGYY